GGWHLGLLPWELSDKIGRWGNIVNVFVFIVKGWLLVFVMMWVRWTLPRLRIDQVMITCLRYLLPISCVLLLGVSVWQLLSWQITFLVAVNYVLAAVCVAFAVWATAKVLRGGGTNPTQMMPGAWPGLRAPSSPLAPKP